MDFNGEEKYCKSVETRKPKYGFYLSWMNSYFLLYYFVSLNFDQAWTLTYNYKGHKPLILIYFISIHLFTVLISFLFYK